MTMTAHTLPVTPAPVPAAVTSLAPTGRVDGVRVLVAETQALVRAGLRSYLERQPGIQVVADTGDGAEAVRLAGLHTPDVVLMGHELRTVDALEATFRIVAADPFGKINVLLVTDSDHEDHLAQAIRAGARGVVLAGAEPDQLLGAVRAVAGGDALVIPSSARRLLIGPMGTLARQAPAPDLDTLTEREREVMRLAIEGLSNDQIAVRLYISAATVKSHLGHVMAKLGVTSRARLIALAYETGLIKPGWVA